MKDRLKVFKYWLENWKPSPIDFSNRPIKHSAIKNKSNIKVYTLTKKWQRFIPKFLYRFFNIKCTTFTNAYPVSIGDMKFENDTITIPVYFKYEPEAEKVHFTMNIDGREDSV